MLLALGSNLPGRWGSPHDALARACRELRAAGLKILSVSHLYKTDAVGGGRQPDYLNAVIVARASLGPGSLLRLAKRLERRAGRRSTPRLRARPLDIDILDFGGRRLGRPGGHRQAGRLILPHPLLHARAFVLVPLAEVAPHWMHPRLGRTAVGLLARLAPGATAGVRRLPAECPPSIRAGT